MLILHGKQNKKTEYVNTQFSTIVLLQFSSH